MKGGISHVGEEVLVRVRGCGLGISPLTHRDRGRGWGSVEGGRGDFLGHLLSARWVMGIQGLGTGVPPDHGSHFCPTQAVASQASELSQLNLCPLSLNEGPRPALMTSRAVVEVKC